jgi:hypothetical protein
VTALRHFLADARLFIPDELERAPQILAGIIVGFFLVGLLMGIGR